MKIPGTNTEITLAPQRGFSAATPPAAISQGTSYDAPSSASAKWDDLPKPDLGNEQGSSRPAIIPEFVPELSSDYNRRLIYGQMMNDVSCDVSVRAVKTPIFGAEFYVDPYSGDQMDIDCAKFINDNLFGGMLYPFTYALEDILHMCEDGYSILQKVYEEREWTPDGAGRNTKNFVMLKSLAARPVSTISNIAYDDYGNLSQITHKAIGADNNTSDIVIDATKLLVFTLNRTGGDIRGKSLLRSAYPHWYYKTHFYKIDAIQKERHSLGVPKGKLLPGYNNEDKLFLRQMLRNLRANEESFILETPNIEVEFAEVKGNLVDVLKSADHHSMMILLNVMAAFLGMGTTESSGGSRASGATQADIFMKSLRYISTLICEIINMHLIPELVVWNFPTRNFPQLKVRNIGETQDLQKLSSAISSLLSQNGITMDLETEQYIRKTFDIPLKNADATSQPNTKEVITDKSTESANDLYGTENTDGTGDDTTTTTTSQRGTTKVGPGNGGNNGKSPIGS